MSLKNNPFYILNLTCADGRRAIAAAAEERSFFVDSTLCSEAQSVLNNPSKRLAAELDWFLDLDKTTLDTIRVQIDRNEIIPVDGLQGLSRLNAILYNLEIDNSFDSFELGYSILEIDDIFASLDEEEIFSILHNCRTEAKLAVVSMKEITEALNSKRNTIRQVIDQKIKLLSMDDCIELATLIAEKCVAAHDYNDGAILSDVLDLYEVQMSAEIENDTANIKSEIERIKNSAATAITIRDIQNLVQMVMSWDKKVQPLQLKSQASGMPHKISEDVGFALRGLAIHLHNEKSKSKEALTLVQAMKPVFAEIGVLSNTFTEDSKTLSTIITNNEVLAQIDSEIESVGRTMTEIKAVPTREKIDRLVSKVKSLNEMILSSDLSNDKVQETREGLCVMVRGLSIELHNTKKETAHALRLAEALVDIFGDIPTARDKLKEDVSTLRQQLRIKEANESQKRTNTIKRIVALAIVACVALWLWIDSNNGHLTKQDVPAVSYSSSLETGTKVYADIKSIFPAVGIYTEGSSNYSDFVCECKTSSGKTVWVYMTTTEYKNNFDSTASTSTKAQYAEEIKFSGTKRIQGTTQKADSVMSGLADDINSTMVINFSSVE